MFRIIVLFLVNLAVSAALIGRIDKSKKDGYIALYVVMCIALLGGGWFCHMCMLADVLILSWYYFDKLNENALTVFKIVLMFNVIFISVNMLCKNIQGDEAGILPQFIIVPAIFIVLYLCRLAAGRILENCQRQDRLFVSQCFIQVVVCVISILLYKSGYIWWSENINVSPYHKNALIIYKNASLIYWSEELLVQLVMSSMVIAASYRLVSIKNKECEEKIKHINYIHNEADINHVNNMYYEAKKLKHNYQNSMISIKHMLEAKEIDRMEEYVDALIEYIPSELEYTRYSDKDIVNYILNEKAKKCRAADIDFKCMINGTMRNMNDVDLSIVLGNILDNAIEAAVQAQDKYVNVSIYTKNKTTIIIENSMKDRHKRKLSDKLLFAKSTKQNSKNHGYGIKSVQDILMKYKGCIVYEIMDNVCICTITY